MRWKVSFPVPFSPEDTSVGNGMEIFGVFITSVLFMGDVGVGGAGGWGLCRSKYGQNQDKTNPTDKGYNDVQTLTRERPGGNKIRDDNDNDNDKPRMKSQNNKLSYGLRPSPSATIMTSYLATSSSRTHERNIRSGGIYAVKERRGERREARGDESASRKFKIKIDGCNRQIL